MMGSFFSFLFWDPVYTEKPLPFYFSVRTTKLGAKYECIVFDWLYEGQPLMLIIEPLNPESALGKQIISDFGSVENFEEAAEIELGRAFSHDAFDFVELRYSKCKRKNGKHLYFRRTNSNESIANRDLNWEFETNGAMDWKPNLENSDSFLIGNLRSTQRWPDDQILQPYYNKRFKKRYAHYCSWLCQWQCMNVIFSVQKDYYTQKNDDYIQILKKQLLLYNESLIGL